jgi:hypothetical protein
MLYALSIFRALLPLLVVLGCSKKAVDNASSKVVFQLPSQSEMSAGSLKALSGFSCFAVNITASDIPGVAPSSCDPQQGVMSDLVPAGGVIELEAPFGQQRVLDLYYVMSPTACAEVDLSQGLATLFGANNVYRLGRVTADFDQPVINVQLPIEFPEAANSVAVLEAKPATCNQNSSPQPKPMAMQEARVVLGASRQEPPGSGHVVHVRVLDQKIDLSPPTNFNGQLRPVRLGEEQ